MHMNHIAGKFWGFCIAWSYPICRGPWVTNLLSPLILEVFKSESLPPRRVYYICTGYLCACWWSDWPCSCNYICPSWWHDCVVPPGLFTCSLCCIHASFIMSYVVCLVYIYELGIYPVVDPLDSTSRMLSPHVLGEDHYNTACGVQKVLQNYKNLQDIIAIWVWMSSVKMTSSLLHVPARFNGFWANLSMWLKYSGVHLATEGKCQKLPGEISWEPWNSLWGIFLHHLPIFPHLPPEALVHLFTQMSARSSEQVHVNIIVVSI